MTNARIKRTQALELDTPVLRKLKSWSFRNIRDLALSIQDEIKCDSEHQIKEKNWGREGFKRQGLGRK